MSPSSSAKWKESVDIDAEDELASWLSQSITGVGVTPSSTEATRSRWACPGGPASQSDPATRTSTTQIESVRSLGRRLPMAEMISRARSEKRRGGSGACGGAVVHSDEKGLG